MVKYAVVETGGKQYLVKEDDLINVDRVKAEEKSKVELETLMRFDSEAKEVDLGNPVLTKKVQAEVVSHLKGDKVRVARFKAKVRYRKVRGFRPYLTTLKIIKI